MVSSPCPNIWVTLRWTWQPLSALSVSRGIVLPTVSVPDDKLRLASYVTVPVGRLTWNVKYKCIRVDNLEAYEKKTHKKLLVYVYKLRLLNWWTVEFISGSVFPTCLSFLSLLIISMRVKIPSSNQISCIQIKAPLKPRISRFLNVFFFFFLVVSSQKYFKL